MIWLEYILYLYLNYNLLSHNNTLTFKQDFKSALQGFHEILLYEEEFYLHGNLTQKKSYM